MEYLFIIKQFIVFIDKISIDKLILFHIFRHHLGYNRIFVYVIISTNTAISNKSIDQSMPCEIVKLQKCFDLYFYAQSIFFFHYVGKRV